ncbi:MAG: hypothetical protein U9N42_11420 [Campylobacterota bacterium]|nr:hypothetical protein [Campylobacterota bacterium]
MKKTLYVVFVGLISIVFSGCVVKQEVVMDYSPEKQSALKSYPEVELSVNDARKYVLSKEKPGEFIGYYRSGVGIPYPVSTIDDVPLAEVIKADLIKELEALGFVSKSSNKSLIVDIKEWKFDAYQNANFNYSIDVSVINNKNKKLVTKNISDHIVIRGTFMGGAKAGVERDMPKIYIGIVKKILRENKEILVFLK